jgi:hypothetical protein
MKEDATIDERIMWNTVLKEWCLLVWTGCSLHSGSLYEHVGDFLPAKQLSASEETY